MTDELGALVASGRKTVTCSALWEVEAGEEPMPRSGARSIILDGRGKPLCIIETTRVEVCRFDGVGERFAREEGEEDRSLAYWREPHRRFFESVLPNICRGAASGSAWSTADRTIARRNDELSGWFPVGHGDGVVPDRGRS